MAAPVNVPFNQQQLDIIESMPGGRERLAAFQGDDSYDALFTRLKDAIGEANEPMFDLTPMTARLTALNDNLRLRLAHIRTRFEYYAKVEGLSIELLNKLANAKSLFNMAIAKLNNSQGSAVGLEQFNAILGTLEGFLNDLDGVIGYPPGGGPAGPPPDNAWQGRGLPPPPQAAAPQGQYGLPGDLNLPVPPNNPPGGVGNENDQLGGKRRRRQTKRDSRRKNKVKKSRTRSRKQRGGFRYGKPKTKKGRMSYSATSTSSSRN